MRSCSMAIVDDFDILLRFDGDDDDDEFIVDDANSQKFFWFSIGSMPK